MRHKITVKAYIAKNKKLSKRASEYLKKARKEKPSKKAARLLQERIELIAKRAAETEHANVDIMHDFRRPFDRKFSVKAVKIG